MPTYLNVEAQSNKFWKYTLQDGNSVLIEWGRVGLDGQSQVKDFGSPSALQAFIDKKIAEKVKKGYKLSDEQELKKQVDIALTLGHQKKISRLEYVSKSRSGNKLSLLLDYDPEQWVYVEVLNSWSKSVGRYLLNRTEAYELDGIAESNRTIEYETESRAPSGEIRALRDVLRQLAEKVVEIVTQKVGAVGARRLNLDGPVSGGASVTAVTEVYTELASSAVSEQVIGKFAALGKRRLML